MLSWGLCSLPPRIPSVISLDESRIMCKETLSRTSSEKIQNINIYELTIASSVVLFIICGVIVRCILRHGVGQHPLLELHSSGHHSHAGMSGLRQPTESVW